MGDRRGTVEALPNGERADAVRGCEHGPLGGEDGGVDLERGEDGECDVGGDDGPEELEQADEDRELLEAPCTRRDDSAQE